MPNPTRSLAMCGAATACLALASGRECGADDAEVTGARLGKIWAAQSARNPVGQARVRLYRYHSALQTGKITVAMVENWFSTSSKLDRQTVIGQIGASFGQGIRKDSHGVVGVRVDVASDGRRVRNDWAFPDPKGTAIAIVCDQSQCLDYSAGARQVGRRKVAGPFAVDATRLDNLLITPGFKSGVEVAGDQPADPSLCEVAAGGARVVCDKESGFVRAVTYRSKNSRSKQFQSFPVEFKGRLAAPGLSCDCTYRESGEVTQLTCTAVDSVALGVAPPPEAFKMSVPAGTVVVDFTKGEPGDPPRKRTTRPIPDVLDYLDKGGLNEEDAPLLVPQS